MYIIVILPQILSIVGKDVFNCQVVLFNKEFTQNYNSDDMKITVDIGCMKIIFLNWFLVGVMVSLTLWNCLPNCIITDLIIFDLQSFLNHFQAAQRALSDASAAAAESARLNAMDAYEKATRMKLNARIKAPIIIIPVHSLSKNALSLDLGLLEVTNHTSEISIADQEEKAVIDEIKLQLTDIKISKVTILSESDELHRSSIDGKLQLVIYVCVMIYNYFHSVQLWILQLELEMQSI